MANTCLDREQGFENPNFESFNLVEHSEYVDFVARKNSEEEEDGRSAGSSQSNYNKVTQLELYLCLFKNGFLLYILSIYTGKRQ